MKKEEKEVNLIQANNLLEIEEKINKKDNQLEKIILIYNSAMKTLK